MSCRMMRRRLAPSDKRTAISRRRAAARARRRLPTLAQASRSTSSRPANNGRKTSEPVAFRIGEDLRAAQADAAGIIRTGSTELAAEQGELRCRLLAREPRREPRRRRRAAVARLQADGADPAILRTQDRRRCHRHPDIHSIGGRPDEPGAGDADDRKRHVVEPDLPADDRGIAAELALPEPMAQTATADGVSTRSSSAANPRPAAMSAPSTVK